MMKRYLTIGLAMACFVGKAETVTVRYHIVNERQEPVSGAQIKTTTERDESNLSWTAKIKRTSITEVSDKDGMASARFDCHSGDFNVYVSADGYYPEKLLNQSFLPDYDIRKGKYKFTKKEKTIGITLMEVRNPIELRKSDAADIWKIPAKIGRYEFDLEKCDWVEPLGKGKIPDVAICYDTLTNGPNYYLSGALEFVNGGAYILAKRKSSSMLSEYCASTNEVYVKRFPFAYRNKADGDYSYSPPLGENDYLVFRVREKRDSQGHLISANYGKIYGPIRASGAFQVGQSFFNPMPNDTNLEAK